MHQSPHRRTQVRRESHNYVHPGAGTAESDLVSRIRMSLPVAAAHPPHVGLFIFVNEIVGDGLFIIEHFNARQYRRARHTVLVQYLQPLSRCAARIFLIRD